MKNRAWAWKILGAIVVLAMLWALLEMSAGARRLQKTKAALQAQGESLNFRDILAKLPGDGANGEMDFLAAIDGLAKPPVGMFHQTFTAPGKRIPLATSPAIPTEIREDTSSGAKKRWNMNIWHEAQPFIEMGSENWNWARRAATNDTIELTLDWNDGAGLLLPHLQGQGYLFSWIRMSTLQELRAGNHAGALEKVVTGYRLLEIYNEPILISAMIEGTCGLMLSDVVWEIWASEGWTEAQLVRLQAAVDSVRYGDTYELAFQMERSVGVTDWDRLLRDSSDLRSHSSAGSASAWNNLLVDTPAWRMFISNPDLAWYLEHTQLHLAAFREAYQARSLSAHAAARSKISNDAPQHYLFSNTYTLAARSAVKMALYSENRRELMVTAIALKRYRLKHDRYPQGLGELDPEFLPDAPIDWVDGRELRYERLSDEEFRLWSVGKDGADTGGDPSPAGSAADLNPENGRDWLWPQISTTTDIEAFIKVREAKMKTATETP